MVTTPARDLAGAGELFFPTNRWQWWVISPNSTKSSVLEHPLRYSTKSMDLGPAPPFLAEQIHGGAAGAGHVWLKKHGAKLVFGSGVVWSYAKHALKLHKF
jgi:hypothetical protein